LRAVISLGTNTTRLLVVRDEPDGTVVPVEHRQTGTRLGEGLRGTGVLQPAAMARTLDAVAEFASAARAYDAALCSIATSAVRRATNAAEFSERMRAVTHVPLEVLEGEAEARASFVGATYGVARDGARVAVIDVGGGSTEVAVGADGVLERGISFEIGSVRVSERFVDLTGRTPGAPARTAAAQARTAIDEELAACSALRPVQQVRAVAGTATTIAAIDAGTHVDAVSGSVLTLARLDSTIALLLELNLEERRALPGMLPQRADILAGGALILSQALRRLDVSEALVEANDLLLGHLVLRGSRA
jgi:exopolyphosphatase / guanosine-5'-triphosphate,3'-diphosphate pyrophosphatase